MDYCIRHYGQEASFAGLAAALRPEGATPARQRSASQA
jgi:hypothetical protein